MREEEEYCYDCQKIKHFYTEGRALFSYNETMRKSIEAFKYKNRQEYAKFYGKELAAAYQKQIKKWGAEAIIPVPIHRSRYLERGYNQAALIAYSLAEYTGLSVKERIIVRTKKTTAQKTLGTKDRLKNLQGAFHLKKSMVQYKKIILVDDIYTTGSTADACAAVLKKGGVEQIYLLCLCIGSGI